jgi:hypothetical protein
MERTSQRFQQQWDYLVQNIFLTTQSEQKDLITNTHRVSVAPDPQTPRSLRGFQKIYLHDEDIGFEQNCFRRYGYVTD